MSRLPFFLFGAAALSWVTLALASPSFAHAQPCGRVAPPDLPQCLAEHGTASDLERVLALFESIGPRVPRAAATLVLRTDVSPLLRLARTQGPLQEGALKTIEEAVVHAGITGHRALTEQERDQMADACGSGLRSTNESVRRAAASAVVRLLMPAREEELLHLIARAPSQESLVSVLASLDEFGTSPNPPLARRLVALLRTQPSEDRWRQLHAKVRSSACEVLRRATEPLSRNDLEAVSAAVAWLDTHDSESADVCRLLLMERQP